jgi:hypothetical protein
VFGELNSSASSFAHTGPSVKSKPVAIRSISPPTGSPSCAFA